MDFAKRLSRINKPKRIDPIEIFSSLPKAAGRGYLRDAQAAALKDWSKRRDERFNIIRMNTGAGKTLVNLLILQSIANEEVGPALYICPNHQLAEQTLMEADTFSIPAVGDRHDRELPSEFLRGDAVYVTVVHKLFNGLTKFGRSEDNFTEVGAILFDDAHACIRAIREQCSITFARSHPAYRAVLELFADELEHQADVAYRTILEREGEGNGLILMVPYWGIHRKRKELLAILHKYADTDEVLFALPLIQTQVLQWEIRISGRRVEITPPTLKLDALPTYAACGRIVLSSATLGDPETLILEPGIPVEALDNAIEPATTWDVGERLILLPQLVEPKLTRDIFGGALIKMASERKVNCVVLVPSKEGIDAWRALGAVGTDISEEVPGIVEALRTKRGITAVLANRYDGVDLPDDVCRVLVIDGIPRGDSLRNIRRARELGLGKLTSSTIAQRIEQGMGRGVRSVDDYCVTIVLDTSLTRFLASKQNLAMLGPATRAQVELGLDLTRDVSGGDASSALLDAVHQVLTRDKDWRALFREQMTSIERTEKREAGGEVAAALRKAYDLDRAGQPVAAREALQDIHPPIVMRDNAWILQAEAQLLYGADDETSAKLQLKAYQKNDNLLRPPKGVSFVRMNDAVGSQATRLIATFGDCLSGNAIVLQLEDAAAGVNFQSDFEDFEQALAELFVALGLNADRPEKLSKKGPDILVRTESETALLIEAKNESDSSTIPKKAFQQLAEDVNWYKEKYADGRRTLCLVAHRSLIADRLASPASDTRVITPDTVSRLRESMRRFATTLAGWPSAKRTEANIAPELQRHRLTLPAIVELISDPLNRS